MAFAEFEHCCNERGLRNVGALNDAGKDMVAWVIDAWGALPTWARTALEYAGTELGDAAVALGWTPAAAGVLGVIASGGLAVGVDILQDCYAQW